MRSRQALLPWRTQEHFVRQPFEHFELLPQLEPQSAATAASAAAKHRTATAAMISEYFMSSTFVLNIPLFFGGARPKDCAAVIGGGIAKATPRATLAQRS